MPPKFGTSGLRGLATDLTAECVAQYVQAFITACPTGAGIYVGHDLRASSPRLADDVAAAALAGGCDVHACGAVPTPALAMRAMRDGAAAIMVTGSHIPADRNGLKFYTPEGEITKNDEIRILEMRNRAAPHLPAGMRRHSQNINQDYTARYNSAFGASLKGMRIGLFAHSAVGRELTADLLRELGADVIILGQSDIFIPVDTEAVPEAFKEDFVVWAADHNLDAIVSTDADGDRPLLTDETGKLVAGDVLGQITAKLLGAVTVVTPISSNSGVVMSGDFEGVVRTKIGSPYVIAGMQSQAGAVAGYEANGGFILGFDAQGPCGAIAPLWTRDAMLPLVATLSAARTNRVSGLVAQQPNVVTASDRIPNVDVSKANSLLDSLATDKNALAAYLAALDVAQVGIDQTDGLRIALAQDQTLHLRMSGNAPELRVYVEARREDEATNLLKRAITKTSNLV